MGALLVSALPARATTAQHLDPVWGAASPHSPSDRRLGMARFLSDWQTLETPHFRIHFEAPYLEYAQRLAAIAEQVNTRVADWLNWQPADKVDVIINDAFDGSNGGATPLAYNRIVLYMNPPWQGEIKDQSPWLELLFLHEYIHIVQLDQAEGFPATLRKVFGRQFFTFPQIFSPNWLIEGLAVYGETDRERGFGRGQGAFYEAMMRAEVMNGLRSASELSFHGYGGKDWPLGQVYLYGYFFFEFIAETYGQGKVVDYVRAWNRSIVPWRMNARARRVFGVDHETLWVQFQHYVEQRFAAQIDTLRANQPSTTPVGKPGLMNDHPAWLADGQFYYRHADGWRNDQIRRVTPDGVDEHVVNVEGLVGFDVHPQGDLLVSKAAICDNIAIYTDLYVWRKAQQQWQRLTQCGRHPYAVWRPDGTQIAAMQVAAGRSTLVLLDALGQQTQELLALPLGDVLGEFAWSADGEWLVASIKRQATGWNLERIRVVTGERELLTQDRFLPSQPRFDGSSEQVVYISERNGVPNVYRLDLANQAHVRLTHTLTGITDFAVNASGTQIRYVEYTADGMVLQEAKLLSEPDMLDKTVAAPPYQVDAYVNRADYQPTAYNRVRPYQPWSSLRPRSWFAAFQAHSETHREWQLFIDGNDALNHHRWQVAPRVYLDAEDWGLDAAYTFLDRVSVLNRRELVQVQEADEQTGAPDVYSLENRWQLLYHQPFSSMSHTWLFQIGAGWDEQRLQADVSQALPYQKAHLLGLSVQWDSRDTALYSVGTQRGRWVSLTREDYGLWGDSAREGQVTTLDWREYIPVTQQQVLAVRYVEAHADQSAGLLRLGGEYDELRTLASQIGFGRDSFALRGYRASDPELQGTRLRLASLEWRVPLWSVFDGWMVPPVGLGQTAFTVFSDTGAAWRPGQDPRYLTSIGVEGQASLLLGFDTFALSVALGFAHGLDTDLGHNDVYVRLGLGF